MMGFEKYRERARVEGKAGADLGNWFLIGLFVALVYAFFPAPLPPVCQPAEQPFLGLEDMDNLGSTLCDGGHHARLTAVAWLVFSGLRAFLISSRREPGRLARFVGLGRQTGPLLKYSKMRLRRRDGGDLALADGARHALLEWLPLHVLSVYVLVMPPADTLYEVAAQITFAMAAQVIWLAPAVFKYRGRNIAEWLTGADVVFDERGEERIARAYAKWWRRWLGLVGYYSLVLFWGGYTLFVVFSAVQIARTPSINPDYERALYAGWETVWEDNANIAMEGLNAPADVTDWYDHARQRIMRQHAAFEKAKQIAGIAQAAPPPGATVKAPGPGEELRLDKDEWKDLQCLYEARHETKSECATAQDVKDYIAANKVIWERFRRVPDYAHYSVTPRPLGSRFHDPYQMAQLKAAEIAVMAREGAADAAFTEWARYMRLYRQMGMARDTMVLKAVVNIMITAHLDVFEILIDLYPELAVTRAAEIDELLVPGGLMRVDNMMADEVALLEPIMLWPLGDVSAVRNDLHECVADFGALARLPVHEYPYVEMPPWCKLQDMGDAYEILGYAFLQPGAFIRNVLQTLTVGGVLKGRELMGAIKQREAQVRMIMLAMAMIRESVTAEEAVAYVAAAPEELRNPVRREPFMWDAERQELYYMTVAEEPGRRAFKVPLAGEAPPP